MAQPTITSSAPRWNPTAPLSAMRGVGALLRPRWMFASLVVVATAVGMLALEISEQDLAAARDARIASNAVLDTRLQAAQAANDRLRIRTADLRLVLAAQGERLASTEGFLK
ncbi:hypothetical protein QL996_12740 [Planococcus sp. APC 4015]|nr:hypothetical protein [Planococcus sp. APC 4015]